MLVLLMLNLCKHCNKKMRGLALWLSMGASKTYKSKDALYKTIQAKGNKKKNGLGFDPYTSKPSERVMVKGVECLKFIKGDKLVDHTAQPKQAKPHASQSNFYASYMLKRNHLGKVVALYVGPRTHDRIVKKNVWVPKMLVTNMRGPKSIWVPKTKA